MYETGSATGVVDLITKLEAFLSANGWTTDSFATEGLGKRYHAHNGSVFLNMRAYNVETPSTDIQGSGTTGVSSLAMNLSSASTGGSRWFDKTGTPFSTLTSQWQTAGMNGLSAAMPKYHFFTQNSNTSVMIVLEYLAGYYQFVGFGTLTKYGTYTGGQYMTGSLVGVSDVIQVFNAQIPGVGFFSKSGSQNSPGFINVTADAEAGWKWSEHYTVGRDTTKRYISDTEARYENSLPIQPNTVNSLAVLMPVVAKVERGTTHTTSDRYSPIGELPGVFLMRISQLTPGQQITIGSTDYRIFPFYHKNSAADFPSAVGLHSSYFGFAVAE